MINLQPAHKPFALLFMAAFVLLFVLLQIALGTDADEGAESNGYYKLIENASLPILLAGNREQLNLQIGSLIRDTPIDQVRVYDSEGNLNFRVQNTSLAAASEIQTIANPMFLDGTAAGTLEVDVQRNTGMSELKGIAFSLFSSVFASLLITAMAYFSSNRIARQNSAKFDEGTPAPVQAIEPISVPKERHKVYNLLVVARVMSPEKTSKLNLSEHAAQLEALSEKLSKLSKLYGLEEIAISVDTITFGKQLDDTTQAVHMAALFGWGLSQLHLEQTQTGGALPKIQCFVINAADLSGQETQSLNFWIELDEYCQAGLDTETFVSASLTEHVDSASFEMTTANNHLHRIESVAHSIRSLWQNQLKNI